MTGWSGDLGRCRAAYSEDDVNANGIALSMLLYPPNGSWLIRHGSLNSEVLRLTDDWGQRALPGCAQAAARGRSEPQQRGAWAPLDPTEQPVYLKWFPRMLFKPLPSSCVHTAKVRPVKGSLAMRTLRAGPALSISITAAAPQVPVPTL